MAVLDFGGHCNQLLFYTACFPIVIHDLAQSLLLTLFTPGLQLHEQSLRRMDGSPLHHHNSYTELYYWIAAHSLVLTQLTHHCAEQASLYMFCGFAHATRSG